MTFDIRIAFKCSTVNSAADFANALVECGGVQYLEGVRLDGDTICISGLQWHLHVTVIGSLRGGDISTMDGIGQLVEGKYHGWAHLTASMEDGEHRSAELLAILVEVCAKIDGRVWDMATNELIDARDYVIVFPGATRRIEKWAQRLTVVAAVLVALLAIRHCE